MGKTITLFHTDTKSDPLISTIIRELKTIIESNEYHLHTINVSTLSIKPCQGCFHCWIKTPGSCIHKDDGNTIAHQYITSDTVIFLSRISFGGYSSQLKCAIDRLIPLILPFFRKYHDETHHKKRYQTYPNLISIGLLKDHDDQKEQLFKRLLERNALNFTPPKFAECIITEKETDYQQRLKQTIQKGTVVV